MITCTYYYYADLYFTRIVIITQADYKITCFEMIDEVISMNVYN